jgi:DNA-directed RNA polymerase subunit RPC12/RpoP
LFTLPFPFGLLGIHSVGEGRKMSRSRENRDAKALAEDPQVEEAPPRYRCVNCDAETSPEDLLAIICGQCQGRIFTKKNKKRDMTFTTD